MDESVEDAAPPAHIRRRCVRHKAHSPAYVSTNEDRAGTGLDLNEILDISEAGMSFQAASHMQLGRRVKFNLDLPETGGSLHTVGRVVWSKPSGETGIRFLKLRGQAFKQLKEWLFVNALVACVHSAAVQARAENLDLQDDAASPGPAPHLEEIEALDQADYAEVLTRLTSIRREADGFGHGLASSLERLAAHAMVFTGASGAAIALARDHAMICHASAGSDAPGVGARFQMGSGFSGECVRSGRPLRCDDSETDPRVDRESCRQLGIRSMMAVPIHARNTVIGLLEVFSAKPNTFGAKDRIFLRRLVEIVLASLHHALQASPAGTGESAVEQQPNPLRFEELTGIEILASGSDEDPPQPDDSDEVSPPPLRWTLVIAAAIALVFAAILVAPRIRTRLGASNRASTQSASVAAGASGGAAKIDAGDRRPEGELDHLHRLAEQGDATAQFALGAHYAIGDTVPQNYSIAAQWFTQAAGQGHVIAQATMGAYYWSGTGVPKDLDKAYFWSVLAQAGGDEASKYRVTAIAAQMSRNQVVAAQDEANDWLKQHQLASETMRDSNP